jgi:FkbM family methyltransferase
LKRFLKFILPWGIVDLAKNRLKLRDIDRRLSPAELFKSDRLVLDAEQSGLSLFAPGHVGKFRNVVDVGANTGQWSSMLLNCVMPEKLVIIEPLPDAFAALQKKFRNNGRVELDNVAIGERESVETLKCTRDTTGGSFLQPREEMRAVIGSNWTITFEVEVPMTTLDRLLVDLAEVSLLKIDVQGYEKQVLAGAKQTLSKTKFVLVELNFMPQYDGGSWFGDVHEVLTRDFGFFLANTSQPQVLNGHASKCDGLYVNPNLVREWVKPDFV